MHICSSSVKDLGDQDTAEATEQGKEEKADHQDLSARCVISAELRKHEVKNRLYNQCTMFHLG